MKGKQIDYRIKQELKKQSIGLNLQYELAVIKQRINKKPPISLSEIVVDIRYHFEIVINNFLTNNLKSLI